MIPAALAWSRVHRHAGQMPEQSNPTQLASAVLFAAMYAVVLLGLAWAQQCVGSRGVYAVAALSGLHDMDAITLSTARMYRENPGAFHDAWRLIVLAAVSNLASKAALAGLLGTWRLFGQILLLFSLPMIGGLAMVFLWP